MPIDLQGKGFGDPVMMLGPLCQGIVLVPVEGMQDIPVTGVVSNSQHVEPGNLFVAVPGFRTDGHDFVDEAVAKGAGALVVEKDVGEKPVPVLRVEDSRKSLAFLADRYFGEPSKELFLVGVTGTNGKTTVAFLLESIFLSAGIRTGLVGTVVYRWQNREELAERTTPDAQEIHCLLRRMKEDGVRAVIIEVSSHALALHRVLGMRFQGAVFTNLSREHLDFHASLADYGETKAKLFGMLSPSGVGIINGDDPVHGLMLGSANGRTVTYGEKNLDVDYRIENVETTGRETSFSIRYGKMLVSLSTFLLGRFNVMNVAAAAVTCLELGLGEDVIRKGVQKVERVRGRMEGIDAGRGFRVIVDYAHTPDALRNVLNGVRNFTQNRLIVVFGCGGDRDRGKRAEMGKVASSLADVVFVTSDNPRSEDPGAIVSDILEGIESKGEVVTILDRKEAIQAALDKARCGDTVILAGKGHETYQQIGDECIPFDDRAVAEAYLKSKEEV